MNNLQLKERRHRHKDPTDPEVMEREFWAFLDKEKAKSMFAILIYAYHKPHSYHLSNVQLGLGLDAACSTHNVRFHFWTIRLSSLHNLQPSSLCMTLKNLANCTLVFKEVWHKADLEPHAQTHYIKMMEMSRKSRRFNHHKLDTPVNIVILRLLDQLDVEHDDVKDLHKSMGKISPFFHKEFFDAPEGEKYKASLLFKQEERAKIMPDSRSHWSNKARPKEFWKEVDKGLKKMEYADDVENLPEEWDMAVRPIIARRKFPLSHI